LTLIGDRNIFKIIVEKKNGRKKLFQNSKLGRNVMKFSSQKTKPSQKAGEFFLKFF
jgi:hypothetical protein